MNRMSARTVDDSLFANMVIYHSEDDIPFPIDEPAKPEFKLSRKHRVYKLIRRVARILGSVKK